MKKNMRVLFARQHKYITYFYDIKLHDNEHSKIKGEWIDASELI